MAGKLYGPVQPPPWGLLGLLNLKTQGQNPDTLLGDVRPTLDLLRLYMQGDARTILTANIPLVATGGAGPAVPDAQVPNGEMWAVHYFSITMNGVLGVGQELSIAPMIEYGLTGGGGGIGVAVGQASRVYTNGDGPMVTADIPGGFLLLPPTSQLYVWVSRITGGPFNANIRARYTPIKL